jgi:hypothetical protein
MILLIWLFGKRIPLVVVVLAIASCKPETDQSNGIICGDSISVVDFQPATNLGIESPESFGGGMHASFIFQDSLGYFLPSKPQNKIFIVDLKSQSFIDEIDLDQNFITYPSGIQVHTADSIFVSDFHFPIIFLINSDGDLLDSYNLYRENLWEMPKEGFANFGLYFGFGLTFKYLPDRNSIIVPLKQMDQWYFVEEKKGFPAVAEYSMSKKEFVNQFGTYEGMYASEQNNLLPFYLSHPIIEVVEDNLILSFSLDPNLYIYSLDGEFIGKKCASFPKLDLGMPLLYDMNNFDTEGMRTYNQSNSYFGNFFYVQDQKIFVRMFSECIKNADEFCSSKKLYAIIFDENLDITDVLRLPEKLSSNAYIYQIGYAGGFLSKIGINESDDLFTLNSYYKLHKDL